MLTGFFLFFICPDELNPVQRLYSIWSLKSWWWEWSVSWTANNMHPSSSPHSRTRSSGGQTRHTADRNRMIGSWIWSHYLCIFYKLTSVYLTWMHTFKVYINTTTDCEWLWQGFLYKYFSISHSWGWHVINTSSPTFCCRVLIKDSKGQIK